MIPEFLKMQFSVGGWMAYIYSKVIKLIKAKNNDTVEQPFGKG